MKNFVSAGCFTIFRKKDKVDVLLIHRKWSKNEYGWVPPKGRMDVKESPFETALRETVEETGVKDIKILQYVTSSEYSFPFKNDTVKKIVHWYLAESKSGKLGKTKHSDHEKMTLDDIRWIPINEAIKILKYQNEKNILQDIKRNIIEYQGDFNDRYYRKYTRLNVGHYSAEVDYYSQAKLRNVEEMLLKGISKDTKILDVACGSGRFSINASRLGYSVVGTDNATGTIKRARQLAQIYKLKNCKFIVADMIHLPFKDNSFKDVLCLRYSLNSVPTYEKRSDALREMFRVTDRGGNLIIETQNMFYMGKGLKMPLTNLFIRYLFRYLKIITCKILSRKYDGLLPGDFVYNSGKIVSAPAGYLHLPSIFEIKSMLPKNVKYEFKSTPEILMGRNHDPFKYWRYSLWTKITK